MTDMTRARAFPGRHFAAQGRALSASGITPPLNRLIALPFDAGGTFDTIGALLKTGGTGDSVVRLGIYGSDGDGLPGALIHDAGEHETDGSHQGPLDVPLDEPRYFDTPFWVAALFGGTEAPIMQASAAIPSIEAQHLFGISNASVYAGIFSVNGNNAVLADYPYDVLPAEFPAGRFLAGSNLWLTVRTPGG